MSMKKVVIGKISAPHGVRGEVRIVPLTDFPERFENLKTVFLEDDSKMELESVKFSNKFIIAKFKNINSRNDIEIFNGKLLMLNRSDIPSLPEGEYYNFDIIGLEVIDDKGSKLGKITEVLKTGSNDVYVVEGKKQILVPALKKVVKEINLVDGFMKVELLEELD
ncbi:MAG: 16S rRNA processing protein RimM [Negativicutes bacterium]|nr:16S rRNA processing protein RimM [Negativicutes bacterium]MBP9536909.1 16S rRNA processing protein RimM [Negativicutes bacterium]MBP9949176.1 16S rRNA processing protein RimM [Negativicutes bacterium]